MNNKMAHAGRLSLGFLVRILIFEIFNILNELKMNCNSLKFVS